MEAHAAGATTAALGLAAWAEWFAVPLLSPERHGPVPYIDFAFQAVALFAGCVVATLVAPLWSGPLRWGWRIAYAAAPASYVGFQLFRLAFV